MGSEMRYFSPSKTASEFFGIKLHDDWGLIDHDRLQDKLLPTGAVQDGYNESLVEAIIAPFRWTDDYYGFDRYHIAFGMINQFCREDIEYFINHRLHQRPLDVEARTDRLRTMFFGKLQWVLSPVTLERLEKHVSVDDWSLLPA